MTNKFLFSIFVCLPFLLFGQTPTPKAYQPYIPFPIDQPFSLEAFMDAPLPQRNTTRLLYNITANPQSYKPPTPAPLQMDPMIERQNQMILEHYEKMERQRILKQQQIMSKGNNNNLPKAVKYDFPDQSHRAGTEHFRNAYTEIEKMLQDEQPLSLKKAVFLAENAFLGNRLNFDWFNSDIQGHLDIIHALINQSGFEKENSNAKKWALQKVMSDTIYIKDPKGKLAYTHLPYRYDFKDPWGRDDWTKQFVTKLLNSKTGQCHSLPLLYLILAEELEIDAWLSYSPSHTYIKVDDGKGNLLNYETTNGYYTTDVWVQSSGYIKAEALRSGIYMDTMSRKEVLASTLADLGKGYAVKYGFDSFVWKCLTKALEYHPNNIYALQLRSDYQTQVTLYVIKQLGITKAEELPKYPLAYRMFLKMHQIYQTIDNLGYEKMPEEVYEKWLQSFENEKARQPEKIIRP